MTAEPTDADRALAASLLNPWGLPASVIRGVAQALAAERERARAPFLALADAIESEHSWSPSWLNAADRIRAAAQEPTP